MGTKSVRAEAARSRKELMTIERREVLLNQEKKNARHHQKMGACGCEKDHLTALADYRAAGRARQKGKGKGGLANLKPGIKRERGGFS